MYDVSEEQLFVYKLNPVTEDEVREVNPKYAVGLQLYIVLLYIIYVIDSILRMNMYDVSEEQLFVCGGRVSPYASTTVNDV